MFYCFFKFSYHETSFLLFLCILVDYLILRVNLESMVLMVVLSDGSLMSFWICFYILFISRRNFL